jgi:hypothetical protein
MTASYVDFQEVANLASHLSPEEQMRLVLYLRRQNTTAETTDTPDHVVPGSPEAILKAMRMPPHLTTEDVDALERAIAAGELPVRREGVFDQGDDA